MKNIEQYVCTFPQAKELKELGVDEKCLFFWEGIEGIDKSFDLVINPLTTNCVGETSTEFKYYSAFTYQEIIEILGTIKTENWYEHKKALRIFDTISVKYKNEPNGLWNLRTHTEFLIYLLENKQ